MLCSLLTVHAQLAGTKWKGVIDIPADSIGTLRPFGVTWIFTKDTATVVYDNDLIEPDVMTYEIVGNKLLLKKVSGGVPCNNTDLKTCTYSIKNDQLSFKLVSDECKPRSLAKADQPFERVK